MTISMAPNSASRRCDRNARSVRRKLGHGRVRQALVVLVGADWCPACQRMKNASLPQVAKRGALSKVAYAVVNTDHEHALAATVDARQLDPAIDHVSPHRHRLEAGIAGRRRTQPPLNPLSIAGWTA